MQTHGNLTASYLWQPGELARRVLGERPAPVEPRERWVAPLEPRERWPPPQLPASISTLHLAYEAAADPRRATLPPLTYLPTTAPVTYDHRRGVCTVGTNTDPPPTVMSRLRGLIKKPDEPDHFYSPPERLTAVRETAIDDPEAENPARRALRGIKKAMSGAKHRIAPGTDTVESPKIVYDMSKPGNRMTTTFGARRSRRWCRLPSGAACSRRLRDAAGWCGRRPRPSPRRADAPALQITQV